MIGSGATDKLIETQPWLNDETGASEFLPSLKPQRRHTVPKCVLINVSGVQVSTSSINSSRRLPAEK